MPSFNLLLLAGDGIGPEVMAEVKRLLGFYAKNGIADFQTEEGLVGGCCYDAHKVAITEATMAKAHAADAVIFGAVGGPKWDKVPYEVRPEAGLLRLRKDLGTVRQYPPGDRLSGARRFFESQARGGRRPRHRHPARTHRRRLFRRAQNHHRSRQRPEARRRYPGLRHLRDRAHRSRRLRAGAQAAQQSHLDGKAQCHEDRRAVARGGRGFARARIQRRDSSNICWLTPAACSWCAGRSSSTSSSPTICLATCCPTSRRCSPARSACCRRLRLASSTPRPSDARRCTSRCTARRPTSPAKAWRTRSPCWRRSAWRCAIRSIWARGRPARCRDLSRARQGPAHRRHQIRRRKDRQHRRNGRGDRRRVGAGYIFLNTKFGGYSCASA